MTPGAGRVPARLSLPARAWRRLGVVSNQAVMASIGRWLHASNAPYMLEHRPDFHRGGGMADYHALRRGWIHSNEGNNGGDFARLYMLHLNVEAVLASGVAGDLVELGVYKGNSAYLLARSARRHGRTTYLFDTFEGFDSRDFQHEDADRPKAFADTSLGAVRRLVGDEATVYVQGYFPESARTIDMPARIAVAHIDCDLYEPMKAALAEFYPRLSPGGLLVMHDYASGQWPGATRAVDEFFADKPEKPILGPDKSGSALIRRAA